MIDKSLYYKYLYIDYYSVTPLYIQLANAITKAIEDGYLNVNDNLPSLNELSNQLELSKDTVEKAYGILKKKKVIDSIAGKGYFVQNTDFSQEFKILLLFNKLSAHKKIIYDAFVKELGDKAAISFYIYNNDYHLFKRILSKKLEDSSYTHYVIIPHFFDQEDIAIDLIKSIPKEKLILMDKNLEQITSLQATIYEDFENDILTALYKIEPILPKYDTLKIVFPDKTYHPKAILKGFEDFCHSHQLKYSILSKIEDQDLTQGSLFITLMEDDLVFLVEKAISLNYKIGEDMGIISYNEVSIKKYILNGITTFSTNFEMIGEKTAKVILENEKGAFPIPFEVNIRPSI